ncbi:MAG TPA: hypothetical protein PK413_14845 [Thermoanaerobaculia bacterium]|nr:hypothetical protein [Thermoanaerobaculia bacterium]
MSEGQAASKVYGLNEGVRVFASGEEIRFRRGVWSFNEAIVRLSGQPEGVVRFFKALHGQLVERREADVEALAAELGTGREELTACSEVLDALKQQQYLHDASQRDVAKVVSALLGGNLSGFENYVGTPRPTLFFSDSPYAKSAAQILAREVGLPLDLLEPEYLEELARVDLTTRTDAVETLERTLALEKRLGTYASVLGVVAAPNLSSLRNLNRLLVRAEKPLILGMIDGPFMSVLSTLATQSGCFECFEQRMLARVEDTVVYHRFVEATANAPGGNGAFLAPPLHMLTAAVLAEGFLYSTLAMMRLSGRIINIYLPLLEIQVQDLLRVPYCPGCGFVSKAQMNELYTSSKRLVGEMIGKVEIHG